jgi:hypothetical protein
VARFTKRPLNRCRACGDTWYPRGRSVSNRCPRCGSADVAIDLTGLYVLGGCAAVLLSGCVLFMCVGFVGQLFGVKPRDQQVAVKPTGQDHVAVPAQPHTAPADPPNHPPSSPTTPRDDRAGTPKSAPSPRAAEPPVVRGELKPAHGPTNLAKSTPKPAPDPTYVITPGVTPVPLAITFQGLERYLAASANDDKAAMDVLVKGEVGFLIDKPTEATHLSPGIKGTTYVRVAEGPHAGKAFVVESKYLK